MNYRKPKRASASSLTRYENCIVTNFIVYNKMRLPLIWERISPLFEQARSRFPGMTDMGTPKEGEKEEGKKDYRLSQWDSKDPSMRLRGLTVSPERLAVVACHPLSLCDQFQTINDLVRTFDELSIVTPLLIDYVDFKVVFEFRHIGNHHHKILDTLFKGSCFDQVVKKAKGTPTSFNPEIVVRHPKDASLRFFVELRPQTSIEEIESRKYDGDDIAAICSAVKVRDFGSDKGLTEVSEQLRKECLHLIEVGFLESVVEPLAMEVLK